MLESLTHESFGPYIGTEFRIHINASMVVPAELVEVSVRNSSVPRASWATSSEPQREPFSVVFRAPLEQPLAQQMYRVEHATIGVIEGLFLVPVGITQAGRFYEAIFS
jgi:hypothetical protein